jgi:hypothetical protein
MKRQILILSAVLLVAVSGGRWLRQQQAHIAFADVLVDPAQLPEACRTDVTIQTLELFDTALTTERFFVVWGSSSLSCVTKGAVTVTVTRRDGSTNTQTEFFENTDQTFVKVGGFRKDNPAISVTATVLVNGLQKTATKTFITDI